MFFKFFLFLFLFFSNCLSQQIINKQQGDQPIEIYAEKGIEWHKNEKKYLAIGNAKATSGSMSLKSDTIEAFYTEKSDSSMDIKLVKAKKNVVVEDESLIITGGRLAEYNLKKDYSLFFY